MTPPSGMTVAATASLTDPSATAVAGQTVVTVTSF
jgi:hypothetical protein